MSASLPSDDRSRVKPRHWEASSARAFHNPNLLFRQAVEVIDKLVNLAVEADAEYFFGSATEVGETEAPYGEETLE